MMAAAKHRDVGRHILQGQKNMLPAKGCREESFVCNRCLQSSSCDKLSCDNRGKKQDLFGEHFTFDFLFFLQDLVDDVKSIIGKMIFHLQQKDCFCLDVLALVKLRLHACVRWLPQGASILYFKSLSV